MNLNEKFKQWEDCPLCKAHIDHLREYDDQLESEMIKYTELEAKYYDLLKLHEEESGLYEAIIKTNKIEHAKKVRELEAELFNVNEHYQQLLINYTEMTDFLAESLHTDSSTAFDLFKHWLTSK